MTAPKILIYDLETSPIIAYTWGLFKQNIGIKQIIEPSRVICWAAKWLGEKRVLSSTEWDDGTDSMLMQLYGLIEEADVIVAHNNNKFDRPTMNAQFVKLGLTPPAPYKSVDTLITARQALRIASNKLDYLGEYLGLGRKIDTGGFELWRDVLDGDSVAQRLMLKYNIQDVRLLEKVYLKLRPWMKNHPNLANLGSTEDFACPNCNSTEVQRRGFSYTQVGKYQRWACSSCGTWSRTRFTEKEKQLSKSMLTQDKNN